MKTIFFSLFFIGSLTVLSSCNKKEDNKPKTAIRLMNASPNAATINLSPDGKKLGGDVSYGSVSEYFIVNAGGFNLRLNLGSSDIPFTNSDVVLDAAKNYTFIIADSISKYKKSLITDNLSDPPAGKSFVRFFHLVGNGPSVNLVKAGSPIFSNRSFNDQANGTGVNYTAIDPGTQTFEMRTSSGGSIIALLSNASITAGKIYTIVARGFVGGAGDQAVVLSMYTDK